MAAESVAGTDEECDNTDADGFVEVTAPADFNLEAFLGVAAALCAGR